MDDWSKTMRDFFDERGEKKAEEELIALLAKLERDGIAPRSVANALSRVLLAHVVRHGNTRETFAWAYTVMVQLPKFLREYSPSLKSMWFKAFTSRTAETCETVRTSFGVEPDILECSPSQKITLALSEPEGSA